MKTKWIVASLIATLTTTAFAQSKVVDDDIYFKPGDDVKKREISKTVKPAYKNGAKEIVFSDAQNDVQPVSDMKEDTRDSLNTNENEQEEGYYLNGFNGSKSDMEYAERIRRFQHPKYRVFIGDPAYNDIYFLNNWDWNVYIEGSYAYVTPTWTNRYWFDYQSRPFSNWSWGYGYSSYYGGYWGYNTYPWSWSSWGWGGGYYGGYYGSYYHGYYNGFNNGYYYGNNWGYPGYHTKPSYRPSAGTLNRNPGAARPAVTGGGSLNRSAVQSNYTSVGGNTREVVTGGGTRSIRSDYSGGSNYSNNRSTMPGQSNVSDRVSTGNRGYVGGGTRESGMTNRNSTGSAVRGSSSEGVSTTPRTGSSVRGSRNEGSSGYSVGSSTTRQSSVYSTDRSGSSSYSGTRSTQSSSSYSSGSTPSYSSGSSSSYNSGSSSSGGGSSSGSSSRSSSGGGSGGGGRR